MNNRKDRDYDYFEKVVSPKAKIKGDTVPYHLRYIREHGAGTVMEDAYKNNIEFRQYVDRYCKSHSIIVAEALSHAIVWEVYRSFTEKEKE